MEGDFQEVFAGYNVAFDRFLVGTEVSFGSASGESGKFVWTVDNLTDAKIGIGFPVGKWLPNVFGGYSKADFYHSANPAETPALTGFNYGAGVDFAIGPMAFIGIAYTSRQFSGNSQLWDWRRFENPLNTLTMRGGIRF